MKVKGYYRLVKVDGGVEPRHTLHDQNDRVLGIGTDAITLDSINVDEYRNLLDMLTEGAALPVLNLEEHPVMSNEALFDLEDQTGAA